MARYHIQIGEGLSANIPLKVIGVVSTIGMLVTFVFSFKLDIGSAYNTLSISLAFRFLALTLIASWVGVFFEAAGKKQLYAAIALLVYSIFPLRFRLNQLSVATWIEDEVVTRGIILFRIFLMCFYLALIIDQLIRIRKKRTAGINEYDKVGKMVNNVVGQVTPTEKKLETADDPIPQMEKMSAVKLEAKEAAVNYNPKLSIKRRNTGELLETDKPVTLVGSNKKSDFYIDNDAVDAVNAVIMYKDSTWCVGNERIWGADGMAEMTGKYVFQDWKTGEVIGRGSFGTVYEIKKQDALGYSERAAMKHISIPQTNSEIEMLQSEGQDEESITETFKEQAREILNEYQLMRKLNDCPNIVSCDDYKAVQHDNDLGWDIFIRMELLTPLLKLPKEQILSEEQIRQLGLDLCHALVYCHKKNILHRDIKPQNIFISADGVFKLGDFGIARIKNGTSTGTARIGTYDYMAPEVFHAQHYGVSADICSLGLVLYWLLNNRRCPFQSTEKQWLKNTEKEEARDRRFAGEAIPAPLNGSEEFKRIVLKACAFDRKDRYQSAEEMLADLAKLGGERIEIPAVPVYPDAEKENESPISDNSGDNNITKETEGTVGSFEKEHRPEEDSDSTEDGETVGVFDNLPQPKKEPTPKPAPKPKKWSAILAAVAALVLIMAGLYYLHKITRGEEITLEAQSSSQLYTSGDYTCFKTGSGVTIAKYTGNASNLVVPEQLDGLSVVGIGYQAFYNCDSLTTIEIPSGVVGIGDGAFSYCDNLATIELPSSVTSIGKRAFNNCSSLIAIEIPSSVTSVDEHAFYDCKSLMTIEIPSSVTSIGYGAFSGCDSLKMIEIPSSVTSIGDYAFFGCHGFTVIELPQGVTSIGDDVFGDCYSLTAIKLPSSLESIGKEAFTNCHSLTEIKIPSGVTSIGDYAFRDCHGLTVIELPQGVTSVGNGIFVECLNLTKIKLPSSVERIGDNAFCSCSNLTTIEIPSSTTSIGDEAFLFCDSLTGIHYTGTREQWNEIEIGADNDPLFNATIHYNSK